MVDRKEILLEVKSNLQKTDTEVGKLVQSMTALEKRIDYLSASQKQLQGDISAGEKVIALYNKTVAEGRPVSDQLRQEYERASTSMDGWRSELTATNEALKAHKKEHGELSRQVQNTIISQETYKDTLKGMAAQLSVEKDKLRQVKIEGGVLTDEYIRQQKVVNDLNSKVSTLEQAYGVYTRNVGNYKSGVQELNNTLRDHLIKLNTLEEGTDEWNKEAEQVKKLTGELENLNREQEKGARSSSTWRDKMHAFAQKYAAAIAVIVAAYKILKGLFDELVKKTQEWGDTFNIEVAGMQSAWDKFIRTLASGDGWNNLISNMQTAYAEGKRLASLLDEMFERENSLKITEADYAYEIEKNKIRARDTTLSYQERLEAANTVIEKEEKLAEIRQRIADDNLSVIQDEITLQTGMDKEQQKSFINEYEQNRELIQQAQAYLDIRKEYKSLGGTFFPDNLGGTQQAAAFGTMTITGNDAARREELYEQMQQMWGGMSDEVKGFAESLKEYNLSNDELIERYVEAYQRSKQVTADLEKLTGRTQLQRNAAAQEVMAGNGGNSASGAGTDAAQREAAQAATKTLDIEKKLTDAMLENQKVYEYDSAKSAEENAELKWQHEQAWATRNFELQQNYERRKLEIQLQYNQITTEEYDNSIKALEQKSAAFYAQQEQEAVSHLTQVTRKVTKALTDVDLGVEIKAVKEQYQELYAGLDAMVKNGLLTYEEASYYRVGLEQKEAREIKAIRERSKKEEEQRLKEESEKRAEKLNTDLKLAWRNAEQQYQIRKRYLEQEMELYKASAAKRAELEQQLAALESEHMQAKIDRMNDYLTQVGELFSSMNDIAANYSNTRVQEAEQQNEQEKAALDKRLKSGLMSQKQYDDKVAKLDADLAAKKAEETRKQAERQKALSVFEIALNTATAIMKIWAEVPKMDFGVSTVALTAVAAAMGALQLGAVLSEPLPKARKGGKIKGAKHEQGGVLVETEGEERIVAAEPAKAYPELLNLISYIGKKKGGRKAPLEPSMTSATESEERKLLDHNKRIVEQNEKVTQINRSNTLLDSIIRGSEILPGSNNDIRFRLGDVIRETDIRHLAMDEVRNSSMDNIISNVTRYGAIPDTGYALRYSEVQARAGASGQAAGKVEIDYERLGEVVGQHVGEEIKKLKIWLSLTELHDAEDNVVHLDELTRQ